MLLHTNKISLTKNMISYKRDHNYYDAYNMHDSVQIMFDIIGSLDDKDR